MVASCRRSPERIPITRRACVSAGLVRRRIALTVVAARREADSQLVDEDREAIRRRRRPDLEEAVQVHGHAGVRDGHGRRRPTASRQRARGRRARVALDEVLRRQALRPDLAMGVRPERREPRVHRELDPRLEVPGERDVLDRAHPDARHLDELAGDDPLRRVEDRVDLVVAGRGCVDAEELAAGQAADDPGHVDAGGPDRDRREEQGDEGHAPHWWSWDSSQIELDGTQGFDLSGAASAAPPGQRARRPVRYCVSPGRLGGASSEEPKIPPEP